MTGINQIMIVPIVMSLGYVIIDRLLLFIYGDGNISKSSNL